MKIKNSCNDSLSVIRHVTWVGFIVNAILTIVKLVCGYLGHSDALVADGVHSSSDFATDFIVLIMVSIAYRNADGSHPYGHGKYETFAALLIGVILCGVGIGLGYDGIANIKKCMAGEILPRPDGYTIIVAAGAIIAKEWLFRYTLHKGKQIDSESLKANAYHHRSDALSSVATLIGVTASYFLGSLWRVLDPVASVLISLLIIVSGIKIALSAIKELLEASLPEKDTETITKIVKSVEGVKDFHHLRTRRNGHTSVVDLHIKVDPNITVTEGHTIATVVEKSIAKALKGDAIVSVHVEPYKSKNN